MKIQLAFCLLCVLFTGSLGFCQEKKNKEVVFQKLPVKAFGNDLVVGPLGVSADSTIMEYSADSQRRSAFVEVNKLEGEIHQVLAVHDGVLFVATSKGAYRISNDGKMTVTEQEKNCQVVTASPDGNQVAIAFLGKYRPFKRITNIRGERFEFVDQKKGSFVEVRIIGKEETKSIYFPSLLAFERVRDSLEGIECLALGKSNCVAAMMNSEGLVIVKDGGCWLGKPVTHEQYGSDRLAFDPREVDVLTYHEHAYRFDLQNGKAICLRLPSAGDLRHNAVGYVIPSGLTRFDSSGKVVSITREERQFYVLDRETEFPIRTRFIGHFEVVPDRFEVSDKYLAWSLLDFVVVFDRRKGDILGGIKQVEEREEVRYDLINRYVRSLCFGPSGLIIATGNGEISEWNPETRKKIRVIVPPREESKATK